MSKLGKVMIAGIVIAIIGVIVLIAAIGMNGWKVFAEYEIKEFKCGQEINTFNLDFEAGVIKTEFYDGEFITIEYPECSNLKTVIAMDKDVLSFTTNYKFKFFQFRNLFQKMPDTVVKVPKNSVLNLNLKVNAGVVDIASGNYGNVNVELNAGVMNFDNINCDKYDTKINAGSIKVQNIKTGDSTIKMNAGDIKFSHIETENLEFTVNAGNIELKDLNCNSIKAKLNAGGISVEKAICKNVYYDINAGKINMNISGKKEEYNIQVQMDSGKCNLQNQIGSDASKIIVLDIDSGKANINFVD